MEPAFSVALRRRLGLVGVGARARAGARRWRSRVENQAARRGWNLLLRRDEARRIADFYGRHAGQRCFILGNGPSLQVADLPRLRGEVTFGHNKIFLAFDETDWRPTYYNVEDYKVIDQNRDRINALQGFPKLLYRYHPGTWVRDAWTLEYDLHLAPEGRFPLFSDNPFHGLYCGFSVCYSSLQWAYFMGFREVYLLGMDFNFVVPNVNERGEIVSQGERNHFSDKYRTPGEIWVTPKLEQQAQAFAYGRDWLSARGVRVYNATRGGKLEVFPRVDFDTLVPA